MRAVEICWDPVIQYPTLSATGQRHVYHEAVCKSSVSLFTSPAISTNMTSKFWHKFTGNIPSIFFNWTLRFLLLRIICISAVLLICSVPIKPSIAACSTRISSNHSIRALTGSPQDGFDAQLVAASILFALKLCVYLYSVCSCTLLHHLAR